MMKLWSNGKPVSENYLNFEEGPFCF